MNDRDRIEDLEEQVRQLRDLLRPAMATPSEWHLGPAEERIIVALARTGTLSHRQMEAVAATIDPLAPVSNQVVKVHLCRSRKKLAPFGIEIRSIFAFGYEFPPESLTLVRRGIASAQTLRVESNIDTFPAAEKDAA